MRSDPFSLSVVENLFRFGNWFPINGGKTKKKFPQGLDGTR